MRSNILKQLFRDILVGLVAGATAAGMSAALCKSSFALAFLFVAAQLVSISVGGAAGLASLAAGALCLAFFFFEPVGSLQIASDVERRGLIWVLTAGAPLCLALAWTTPLARRLKKQYTVPVSSALPYCKDLHPLPTKRFRLRTRWLPYKNKGGTEAPPGSDNSKP
jgi:K+-sensing histidine kinase KdpD